MNARLKYITIKVCDMPFAILLYEGITHSEAINQSEVKPLSAGFCVITDSSVKVEAGESVSLNLGPKPGDAQIIEDTLALMGLRPLTESAIRRQYLRA